MRVELKQDGILHVSAETELEAFALDHYDVKDGENLIINIILVRDEFQVAGAALGLRSRGN